jgi:hypothetical protein
MANSKISALTAATVPLAGTEVLAIVQSSTTKQVSVANLTAGRGISATTGTFTGAITPSQTAGIVGTTTNNNANAGSIGEVVSSSVAVGSAVSITTATTATSGKTVTSISLTAGDWNVFGTIGINLTTGTKFTVIGGGINTVTNELNALYEEQLLINYGAGGLVPLNTQTFVIPTTRVSIASTTTYYLIAYAQFTVNTATGYGRITARRMR